MPKVRHGIVRLAADMNIILIALALPGLLLILAIMFGGPTSPPPMMSINAPFGAVDYSGMPAVSTVLSPDGQMLVYREYTPLAAAKGSVTLIHGSAASSSSMHPIAKALAIAGYRVFSLDVRGHGLSGSKGHIDYIGQLESDLSAFVEKTQPDYPSVLIGFSSGGGFALRFAGSKYQTLFDSYLLLSPFISQNAPTQRKNSGGWVNVGIPRIVAIGLLNLLGIHALNTLPVIAFALDKPVHPELSEYYDFNLAMNFRPNQDYSSNIKQVFQPVTVLVGEKDEVFVAEKFHQLFEAAGKDWQTVLLPGIDHIGLTLAPTALAAIVCCIEQLTHKR